MNLFKKSFFLILTMFLFFGINTSVFASRTHYFVIQGGVPSGVFVYGQESIDQEEFFPGYPIKITGLMEAEGRPALETTEVSMTAKIFNGTQLITQTILSGDLYFDGDGVGSISGTKTFYAPDTPGNYIAYITRVAFGQTSTFEFPFVVKSNPTQPHNFNMPLTNTGSGTSYGTIFGSEGLKKDNGSYSSTFLPGENITVSGTMTTIPHLSPPPDVPGPTVFMKAKINDTIKTIISSQGLNFYNTPDTANGSAAFSAPNLVGNYIAYIFRNAFNTYNYETETFEIPFAVKEANLPTITVTANPSYVVSGNSSVVNWTSTGTNSCHYGNTTIPNSSGSFNTGALNNNINIFDVTCYAPGSDFFTSSGYTISGPDNHDVVGGETMISTYFNPGSTITVNAHMTALGDMNNYYDTIVEAKVIFNGATKYMIQNKELYWDTNPNTTDFVIGTAQFTAPSTAGQYTMTIIRSAFESGTGSIEYIPIYITTAPRSITGQAKVFVPSVELEKNPVNFKNLVRYNDTTDPATGHLRAYVNYLPNTGDHCHIIKNGIKQEAPAQIFSNFDTGVPFEVKNLNAPNNNDTYQLKCYNASELLLTGIQSEIISFYTQNVIVNGTNSCFIPVNQSSCSVPLNWSTKNPLGVITTNITDNGELIKEGNTGDSVIVSGQGMAINQTQVSKTIDFKNKVDGEDGTGTPAPGVVNIMKSQPVTLKCAQGPTNPAPSVWSSKWNGSVCYNAPPVANAGSDQTIATTTATLTGSATDADGPGDNDLSYFTYYWEKVGNNSATFSNQYARVTNISELTTAGVYKFKLTVTNTINNVSQSSSDEVTIIKSATNNFTLSVSKDGDGTGVVKSGEATPKIDCGTDCSEVYASGISVTLTATPTVTNSLFAGWVVNGNTTTCSGTGTCTVTMNQGKNVVAIFIPFTVQVTADTPYTVNPSSRIDFAYNATTTSPSQLIECRLLGSDFEPLTDFDDYSNVNNTIQYTSPTNAFHSPYGYYINCRHKSFIGVGDNSNQILVNVNNMPQVDAGPDKAVSLPNNTSVVITGTASDPDGPGPLTITWKKQSGPSGGNIVSPNSLSTNITGLIQGTYIYKLEAGDGLLVNSDTMEVVVSTQEQFSLFVSKKGTGTGIITSDPEGISCGNDCSQIYPKATNVTLIATPTVANSFFVGWVVNGNIATCPGTGICTVTMNEAKNVVATFTFATIAVIADPSNYFINPDSGISFTYSTIIKPEASPASCRLLNYNQVPLTQYVSSSGSIPYDQIPSAGGGYKYYIQCIINSFSDISDISDRIIVTVNSAPIANAGPDASITGTTTTYTVSGASASDSDGGTLTYEWKKFNSAVTIAGGNTLAPTFGNMLQIGSYVFELIVTDNLGLTHSDQMTVVKGASGYTLSVSKDGTGTGVVKSGEATPKIDCGTDCSEVYASGISVTLTATPTVGNSFFAGWKVNGDATTCPGTGTCTVTMNGAKNVVATFTLFTVEVRATTPYSTPPLQNVSFEYVVTTNSQFINTQCRLLNNGYVPLTEYKLSSPITYLSPSIAGSYAYYIQCIKLNDPSITSTSNQIIVNVTSDNVVPTVRFPSSSEIAPTTATLGANVRSLGVPASLTELGFCYGTAPNPVTTCDQLEVEGGTTGVFTKNIKGLTAGTLYYYRGYAKNQTGTGYSEDGTFTTSSVTIDLQATAPTQDTAVVGTAKSFTSTISNLGNTTTGGTFLNSLQVATGEDGSGAISPLIVSTPNPMPALDGRGFATATASYTFPTAGIWYVRFCADNNAQMTGSINELPEGNEGNNCSDWTKVTAIIEEPDLQAEDPYIMGNFNLENMIIYSKIKNTGNASTDPNASEVEIGFIDFIKNLFKTKNVFAGPEGETPEITGFYNLFQVTTDPKNSKVPVEDYKIEEEMKHIPALGYRISESPITEFTQDDWVRFCADKDSAGSLGVINEWNNDGTGEANNCSGWISVMDIAQVKPEGYISLVEGCYIQKGENMCDAVIGWTTSNTIGTPAVTSDWPSSNAPVGTGQNNPGLSVSIPYSSRNFYLIDNEETLHELSVKTDCDSGLVWNPDSKSCKEGNPGSSEINLKANRYKIVKGSSVTISWDASSWASSCTATRDWDGEKESAGEEPFSPEITSTYSLGCTPKDPEYEVPHPEQIIIKVIEPKVKEN